MTTTHGNSARYGQAFHEMCVSGFALVVLAVGWPACLVSEDARGMCAYWLLRLIAPPAERRID